MGWHVNSKWNIVQILNALCYLQYPFLFGTPSPEKEIMFLVVAVVVVFKFQNIVTFNPSLAFADIGMNMNTYLEDYPSYIA